MDGHTTSDSAPAQDLARAILNFGPIEECAVISRTAPDGGERYVAYVVASGHVDGAVRQHLQAHTPRQYSWIRAADPQNAEGAVDECDWANCRSLTPICRTSGRKRPAQRTRPRSCRTIAGVSLLPSQNCSARPAEDDAGGRTRRRCRLPQGDRLSISEGPRP
jgi:hypothetical protein